MTPGGRVMTPGQRARSQGDQHPFGPLGPGTPALSQLSQLAGRPTPYLGAG